MSKYSDHWHWVTTRVVSLLDILRMLEVELTKQETLWSLSYKYVDGFQEEVERLDRPTGN